MDKYGTRAWIGAQETHAKSKGSKAVRAINNNIPCIPRSGTSGDGGSSTWPETANSSDQQATKRLVGHHQAAAPHWR